MERNALDGFLFMKNPSAFSFIRWFADITTTDILLKTTLAILATEKTVPDGTYR